jgi:signal transduction histidine kinase
MIKTMYGQYRSYMPNNKGHLILASFSVLAYLILSLLLYPSYGASVGYAVLLPIVMIGWFFGLRVALVAGLLCFLLNILTLRQITNQPLAEVLQYSVSIHTAMILISMVVICVHDLSESMKQELKRRTQVEASLQESEIRFRTLVEQSPFSTQIFRPDGSVIMVNQAFCTLWNATPSEAQYVIDNYNILMDEQLETMGLFPFIKRGFTDGFTEIPAILYDPQKTEMVKNTSLSSKWVVGYIWPVKNEQGHVQQVVLMHQDITERKKVEEQQLELAVARERADLLRELLSTLAHDLKTPLSIIGTSVYLFERSSDTAYQQNKIDIIKEQAQHLNTIIQNILTASYLETAPYLRTQALNLNAIVEQVQQEFGIVAEYRSITFELKLESKLPLVRANEEELRRVLVNLVENALHYTPSEGQISLRTFREVSLVAVEVRDTGIGIEEAELPYIFDHFYRVDKARTTNNAGTGLGLAIAKQIVERHQGRIEVESKLGQGSTFTVWLPMALETNIK